MAILKEGDSVCYGCGGVNEHSPSCTAQDVAEVISVYTRAQALEDGVSQQNEKFLFQQSRKFLFETGKLAG